MRIMLAFTPLLLIAAVASAQKLDVPVPDKKKDPGSEMVCKRDQFVGSKISRKVCMTRLEWEKGRTNAQDALDERQMWKNNSGKGGG